MPLTLRDLAPLLTPYQAPIGFDASGIANNLNHAAALDESARATDLADAQHKAQLAETTRANMADEQHARDVAAATLAAAQHTETQKLLGESAAARDPNVQHSLEAQFGGAGIGVRPAESTLATPDIPKLSLPSAPQATGQNFPPSLGMTSLDMGAFGGPGTAAAAAGVDQGGTFPGSLGMSLDRPSALDEPAPLPPQSAGTITQGALIDQKTGAELGGYDPHMMRQRAIDETNAYFNNLIATSSPMDRPIAQQAKAAAIQALPAMGYDPKATIEAITKSPYDTTQSIVHADARSAANADAISGRAGSSAAIREFKEGQNAANTSWTQGKASSLATAYQQTQMGLETLKSDPNNAPALASVIYEMAHAADPGAKLTDKDIGYASGQAGLSLLDASTDTITRWIQGGMSAGRLDMIKQALQLKSRQIDHMAALAATDLREQRDSQPSDMHRKGFDSVIERFHSMPFYRPFRADDADYARLRQLQLPSETGTAASATVSHSQRGVQPVARPEPATQTYLVTTPDGDTAEYPLTAEQAAAVNAGGGKAVPQ